MKCPKVEWYSAKSPRMGESCSHPPGCSPGPAITLAHLHGCYVHEQVIALSKNQYLVKCEPLDLIESNEKGAQHHAPAAIRYLQPGWCRMVLHTPHICHGCITRHLFISNYPWSSYVPRPHTTHRAHKAHTDCTVIDRAQKLLVHTWCAHERQHIALQLCARARLRQW